MAIWYLTDAHKLLMKATALVSNKDIEHFIPAPIKTPINPAEEVPKTLDLLSAMTFVSEVDSATLSLMVPLLSRGLNKKLTATKRHVAVITDKMAKLADSAVTVHSFIPKLLPSSIKIGEVPADSNGSNLPPIRTAEPTSLANGLIAVYKKQGTNTIPAVANVSVTYASHLAANLVNAKNFDISEWDTLAGHLDFIVSTPHGLAISREWVVKSASNDDEDAAFEEDEEEGKDLCNCEFSLAYGAKILLNTANLHLKRGHRYGLCGRNGTGKSTLVRAVNNGQVEGFPSPDEVQTFYIEHDIDGSEAKTSILDFILSDNCVLADKPEVISTLTSVGFNDERQGLRSLSGGWKMKLALAHTMLFKADILLLDEPTNHLNVVNIAWLENYLTSLTTCTPTTVSCDSSFLNNVITDVLHLNRFKLRRYRGNLEHFMQVVPEAKSYYTLEALQDYTFKFPPPCLRVSRPKRRVC